MKGIASIGPYRKRLQYIGLFQQRGHNISKNGVVALSSRLTLDLLATGNITDTIGKFYESPIALFTVGASTRLIKP